MQPPDDPTAIPNTHVNAHFDRTFMNSPELLDFLRVRGISEAVLPRAARLTNLYDGEILYADAQLGRLLAALRASGVYERAALVVTADHGEGILQHGELQHGVIWNEQLAVPLVMRWPGAARARQNVLASLLDVLPTLAVHAGLPLDAGRFDGVDLLAGTRDTLISQRALRAEAPAPEFTLRRGRWKYWRESDGAKRLYDLEHDPHELRDVSAEHPDVVRALEAELERGLARHRQRPGLVPRAEVDAALREKLRALGYVE